MFRHKVLHEATIPPAVQERLVHEYPDALAYNKQLTADVADMLLGTKLDADAAAALYSRPMTATQRDKVIKKERRTGPLSTFVETHWDLCDADQKAKVVKVAKGSLADDLLGRPGVDAATLWPRCSLGTRMTTLATLPPARLPDDIIVEALRYPMNSIWSGSFGLQGWVAKAVCAGRPHLMDVLLGDTATSPSFLTAAAGSLHLDASRQQLLLSSHRRLAGWVYRALVANPRVTDESLTEVLRRCDAREVVGDANLGAGDVAFAAKTGPKVRMPDLDCDDPEILGKVVQRALPNRYTVFGRPFDLVVLTECPNLGPLRTTIGDELVTFTGLLDCPTDGIPTWLWDAACARLRITPTVEQMERQRPYDDNGRGTYGDHLPPADFDVVTPRELAGLWPAARATEAFGRLSQQLGDNPDVWRFVIETGDRFNNPVSQLVNIARASIGVT